MDHNNYQFRLDESGKIIFFTHAITNDTETIYCESERRAEIMKQNSRYADWYILNLKLPDENLQRILSGMRFDDDESARRFLESGYLESVPVRLAELEQLVVDTILGGE